MWESSSLARDRTRTPASSTVLTAGPPKSQGVGAFTGLYPEGLGDTEGSGEGCWQSGLGRDGEFPSHSGDRARGFPLHLSWSQMEKRGPRKKEELGPWLPPE